MGLAGRVPGLHWENRKPVKLKGMSAPERVVEVLPDQALAPVFQLTAGLGGHGRRVPFTVAAVVAVAVVGGVLLVARHGSAAAVVATPPDSVAAVDPQLKRVVADVPICATPEGETAGFGKVWVGTVNDSIEAVSPSSRHAQSQESYGDPAFLAVGAGAVWSYDGKSRITELVPTTLQVVADRSMWGCDPRPTLLKPGQGKCVGGGVTVVGNEVWVGRGHNGSFRSYNGELVRYDATTLRQVSSVAHVTIGGVAQGGDTVWSLGDAGTELDGIPTATGSVAVRRFLKPAPRGHRYCRGQRRIGLRGQGSQTAFSIASIPTPG